MLLAIDGTDRVNDIKRRQLSTCCDHGFARRQSFRKTCAANLETLFEYLRSAGPMDGAINSTTAEQRRIRRIYDCLDILLGDVADDDSDAAIEKALFGFRVQALACRPRSP